MSGIDIIDRIDALVDDQMAEGEPRNGFYFGDPTYPRCPQCNRHWHGLRITQRIANMYASGRYDPAYSAAGDDTPTLCEGSEFIGPKRPPAEWGTARYQISISIGMDTTDFIQALHDRMAELMFGPCFAEAMRTFGGSMPSVRLFDSGWSQIAEYTYPEPVQCTDDIVVEFGPQNWVHEFRRIPNHSSWSYVVTPNTQAVAMLWDKFTAPDYPIPVSPGIDFDAIPVNAYAGTGPKPKPLGRRARR
jgi:hypothetical protein